MTVGSRLVSPSDDSSLKLQRALATRRHVLPCGVAPVRANPYRLSDADPQGPSRQPALGEYQGLALPARALQHTTQTKTKTKP